MKLKKYLVSQSIFWAARINLTITDGVGTTSIFEVLTTYFHEISVQNFEFFTNVSYENKTETDKNSIRYY